MYVNTIYLITTALIIIIIQIKISNFYKQVGIVKWILTR